MSKPLIARLARLFATVVLALLVVTTASVAQTEVIHLGTGPDEATTPLLYGVAAGIYKKYGVDVEIVRVSGGAAAAAAIVGGTLQIGKLSTLGFVQAVGKGVPFTALGAGSIYNVNDPDTVLVVSANAGIATAKDLVGKTLATVSLGDQNAVGLFAWLDQRGVDPSSIKYVELPAEATLPAMEAGRVSGATIYEPFYSQAVSSGKATVLGHPYDAFGRHFAQSVLVSTKAWADGHRDIVARFLRATQEAAQYVGAHEAESAALTMKFTGAAAPAKRHPIRGVALVPSDVQPLIDTAAKYKIIPSVFSARDSICSCALTR